MFRKLAVLFCLVVVTAALADNGVITGKVFDSATQLPIQGALVGATGPSGSGQAGTYLCGTYFISVPHGKYRVSASATGYESACYPESVLVQPGETTYEVNFHLTPTQHDPGAISGRVYDAETRLPIQGALARATGPAGSGQAETYPCGSYFITNLPVGKYRVQASATGYECAAYPESVLTVAGDTVVGIDFYLERAQQNHGGIRGMVKNRATGQVITGAVIRAARPGFAREVVQERDGYLVNELPAGKYWVSATAVGFAPGAYPESVLVVAGQTTPEVTFCMEPTGGEQGGIQGQVLNSSNGQVIVHALVTASNGRVTRRVLQTNECYRILELPPGKYWVSARAEGFQDGHYPDSVVVEAGQITYEVRFHLEPRPAETGKLAGVVFDAATREPVLGALVVAAGPSQGRANTCREGRFVIPNLLPGRYVVEVAARGYEPFREDGIVIEAGQVTDISVELQPQSSPNPGAIAGTVKDSVTSEPLVGARVFAWGRAAGKSAATDSIGHYLVSAIPAGQYVVRACAQGYRPKLYPDTVEVLEGRVVDGIDFLLAPTEPGQAGIAGFILDGASRLELAGATVRAIGASGEWLTTSGSSGDYLFDGLVPGDYLLEVSAPAYSTELTPEPTVVVQGQITSFVCPAVYPLSGMAENPAATRLSNVRLSVFPNPAAGHCQVRWQIERAGGIAVQVVDNAGRVVRNLSRAYQAAGSYSAVWDRCDSQGRSVAAGIYFLRLVTEDQQTMTKAVLLSE